MLGEYIDIHNHILPGVDDGAKSMEETIAMLEVAISQGISTMIATPHYECGRPGVSIKELNEIKEKVEEEAKKLNPHFTLYLGHELMYSDSLLEDVKGKKALTLGETRYVLIEFSIGITYEAMYEGMKRFVNAGYLPIIAHMERYHCLRKNTEGILDLIDLGCYMQMNSSTLTGGIFDRESTGFKKLVMEGYIHFIASDSHDRKNRIPCMKRIADSLSKKLDKARLDTIFIQNPKKLLENKYI